MSPAETQTHTHTFTPVLVLCLSGVLHVQSLHTDWLVLRAGPSPPQDPGLVADIVPCGSELRAQQVSLPDWPRHPPCALVSAALSQLLSWPNPFSPHWRLTRVPDHHRSFPVGTSWLQETICNPGGQGMLCQRWHTVTTRATCVCRVPVWQVSSGPGPPAFPFSHFLTVEDHNCCSLVPSWAGISAKIPSRAGNNGCL